MLKMETRPVRHRLRISLAVASRLQLQALVGCDDDNRSKIGFALSFRRGSTANPFV